MFLEKRQKKISASSQNNGATQEGPNSSMTQPMYLPCTDPCGNAKATASTTKPPCFLQLGSSPATSNPLNLRHYAAKPRWRHEPEAHKAPSRDLALFPLQGKGSEKIMVVELPLRCRNGRVGEQSLRYLKGLLRLFMNWSIWRKTSMPRWVLVGLVVNCRYRIKPSQFPGFLVHHLFVFILSRNL